MRSPVWIFVLFTVSGLFAGATYLHRALTEGPLARNLVIAGLWIALGGFWLLALTVRVKAARNRSADLEDRTETSETTERTR